jgi:hypothetical protein
MHTTFRIVPWISTTLAGSVPAFWWSSSMFCVTRVCSFPRRSRATIARCPALGSACLPDLGIGQVVLQRRRLLGARVLRPNALRPAEIGDPGVGGDARTGEHHDLLRPVDQASSVIELAHVPGRYSPLDPRPMDARRCMKYMK